MHAAPLIAAGLRSALTSRDDVEVTADPSSDIVLTDPASATHLLVGGASTGRVVILWHDETGATIRHAFEQGARGYLLITCSVSDLLSALDVVHAGGCALDSALASRVGELMMPSNLTHREEDVLGRLMLGHPNRTIARQLRLTEGTVKWHVRSILEKLGASNRTEAAALAQRRGLVRAPASPMPV